MRLGSRESTRNDQTSFLASGKAVRRKVAPRSVLRHTPSLVPANTVSGLLRMDEHGEGLDGAQHMLPVAARGTAAEDADPAGMVGLPEVAGDADIDVGLVRSRIHGHSSDFLKPCLATILSLPEPQVRLSEPPVRAAGSGAT